MKQGALIFNIVLAVAVAVLFYFQFAGKPGGKSKNNVQNVPLATDSKILYVDQDSLNAGYVFFAELEQKFTSDNQVRQEKLQNMQRTLEGMVRKYEQGVMTMTTRERQKEEERIGQYQQNFQNEAQQFQQLAAMQEAQMITQIYDSLDVFFKEYAVVKGCDMIFTGGVIDLVHAHIDHRGAVLYHIGFHKMRRSDRRDQDIRFPAHFHQVGRFGVAEGDGGVTRVSFS